jgi:hypothetical protein
MPHSVGSSLHLFCKVIKLATYLFIQGLVFSIDGNLRQAIEIDVLNSRIRQNASELGDRIRTENGVQIAIDLIEGMSVYSVCKNIVTLTDH